jgi:cysteine desulfurase
MPPIYLDYNATTPIDREVADAMAPFLYEHFGNPSSAHPLGAAAKRALEAARGQVAALLGCRPPEVVFTSGGTESDNLALRGVARARRGRGRHLITSAVEHPAVAEVCRALAAEGFRLTVLPVDGAGRVDPADLEAALTPETILVSVMHANNEVGTIQPIARLAALAHRAGALFHTDAAQSVGKIAVDVDELGVDLLTVAGHKLYGPKGVGALYVREGVELAPLLLGAPQEGGRRPGTENLLEVVGLGRACEVARRRLEDDGRRLRELRDRLWEGLAGALGEGAVRLNGDPEERLPNTLSVSFRGVDAATLLAEIGDEVAASAGAACHADRVEVSEVLEAMGVPVEWAMGTVRLSVGRHTTGDEIRRAVAVVSGAVARLQPGGEEATGPAAAALDPAAVRLTRFTHGMGCACKLRPQALEEVLAKLPVPTDPAVLVGAAGADDAAVYRLTDELALVVTVDFFTPIVDDPYWFGAISAANSLSDVYAMGARPLFALNVVGFPERRLPLSVLERILAGAADKAAEAGVSILGGHTVEDTEPKFGLAVTGVVHPDRVVTNAGARPGDLLVLTKPLGLGIVATALKQGLAGEEAAMEAREVMATLNRGAAEAMVEVGVHAATDVTGFGLLGHGRELAAASGVDLGISVAAVPVLAGARELAAAGAVPGGTLANLEHVSPATDFAPGVTRVDRLLLADAQTSGGLLISVAEAAAPRLLAELERRGVACAATIGRVTGPGEGRIRVVPG